MNDNTRDYIQAVVDLMESASVVMMDHRDDDYPHEAVGILCSDGTNYRLINQARSAHRFEVSATLSAEAMSVLLGRDKEPIAIYHSHPTSPSGPSKRDITMMETQPGALSIIVGVSDISAWVWDNEGLQPVGRIPLPERSRIVQLT